MRTSLLLALLVFCTLVAPAWADITTGLVLHWAMDEGSLTTLTDTAPGGTHPATLASAPATPGWLTGASCKFGACLNFDGVDDKATFAAFATGTTYTYAAWVYPTTATVDYGSLFTQPGAAGVFVMQTSGRQINFYYGGDHLSTGQLTANTWNHIAVVCSAGAVTFYLNGSTSGTATSAPSFSPTLMGDDETGNWFTGRIDDVHVFSRALSAGDIAELMAGPVAPDITTGLVLHYKFNDNTGTSAVDSGSGAQNGTLSGGVTWTKGVIGPAVHFANGGTDIVTAAGTTVYAPSGSAWSFAAWILLDSFAAADIFPHFALLRSNTTNVYECMVSNDVSLGCGAGLNCTGGTDWAGVFVPLASTQFTGRWRHVVLTYNGSGATTLGNFAVYLDGIVQTTTTASCLGGKAQQTTLGSYSGASAGEDWNGSLDEVRVYTRALSATDVRTLTAFGRVKHATR